MSQNDELLPCPFCGGVGEIENIHLGNPEQPIRYSVGCTDAECIGYQMMTTYQRQADAVTAWNRRPSPAQTLSIGGAP